ncbi:MAG: hypothetical protein ACRET5_15405 [Steroidobacteraceae bacterium]
MTAAKGSWGEALNRRCAAHSLAFAFLTAVLIMLSASGQAAVAAGLPKPRILAAHERYERLVDGRPYRETLAPLALEYPLIGPIAAEIADVSSRGDLFGVSKDSAVHVQVIDSVGAYSGAPLEFHCQPCSHRERRST